MNSAFARKRKLCKRGPGEEEDSNSPRKLKSTGVMPEDFTDKKVEKANPSAENSKFTINFGACICAQSRKKKLDKISAMW